MKKLYKVVPLLVALLPLFNATQGVESTVKEDSEKLCCAKILEDTQANEEEVQYLVSSTMKYFPETTKLFEKHDIKFEEIEGLENCGNLGTQIIWMYSHLQGLRENSQDPQFKEKMKPLISDVKKYMEDDYLKRLLKKEEITLMENMQNIQKNEEEKHILKINFFSKEESAPLPQNYDEIKVPLKRLDNKIHGKMGYEASINEICAFLYTTEQDLYNFLSYNIKEYNKNVPVSYNDMGLKGLCKPHQCWFLIHKIRPLVLEMAYIARETNRLYKGLKGIEKVSDTKDNSPSEYKEVIDHILDKNDEMRIGEKCQEETGINFPTLARKIESQVQVVQGLESNLYAYLEDYFAKK